MRPSIRRLRSSRDLPSCGDGYGHSHRQLADFLLTRAGHRFQRFYALLLLLVPKIADDLVPVAHSLDVLLAGQPYLVLWIRRISAQHDGLHLEQFHACRACAGSLIGIATSIHFASRRSISVKLLATRSAYLSSMPMKGVETTGNAGSRVSKA